MTGFDLSPDWLKMTDLQKKLLINVHNSVISRLMPSHNTGGESCVCDHVHMQYTVLFRSVKYNHLDPRGSKNSDHFELIVWQVHLLKNPAKYILHNYLSSQLSSFKRFHNKNKDLILKIL